jgi:hypothetical protein
LIIEFVVAFIFPSFWQSIATLSLSCQANEKKYLILSSRA